jgi:hypothetical protein
MKKHGQRISLSVKTDPRKTYNWRFLSHFLDEIEKYEMNEHMVQRAIEALIGDAKNHRMLHRGMAILNNPNLIHICVAKLEREIREEREKVDRIDRTHSFIQEKCAEAIDTVGILLSKDNPLAYSNMTRWYQTGKIDIGYIALSKTCMRALGKMDKVERMCYPTPRQLLQMRLMYLSDDVVHMKLKNTLKNDLIEE